MGSGVACESAFAPHNAIDATHHCFLARRPSFPPSSKSKTPKPSARLRGATRTLKDASRSARRAGEGRFDDGPKGRGVFASCCLCFDAIALDHRHVISGYRMTAKVYVRDATTAAPLAPILFGGRLTVHHERGIISVDEKVHFRAPPKVATLASILRSELEALLLRKIVTPDAQVDERERAFVDAKAAGGAGRRCPRATPRSVSTNKGAAFQRSRGPSRSARRRRSS